MSGEVVETEAVSYGKPEVSAVMEAFTNYWGVKPAPYIRQRHYANTLVKLFGDKTMDVVNYALSIQSDYYAPQITSPKDLYYKHLKVMAYYRNNEGESGNVVTL
jgi:hypothetical protein